MSYTRGIGSTMGMGSTMDIFVRGGYGVNHENGVHYGYEASSLYEPFSLSDCRLDKKASGKGEEEKFTFRPVSVFIYTYTVNTLN